MIIKVVTTISCEDIGYHIMSHYINCRRVVLVLGQFRAVQYEPTRSYI